jgi:transcriptional regulator with XRE-family HTH domain
VAKDFATALKQARYRAGFRTAKSFADALGIDADRYRHWERGSATPDIAMVSRICKLLDITPNDLLPHALKKKREKELV